VKDWQNEEDVEKIISTGPAYSGNSNVLSFNGCHTELDQDSLRYVQDIGRTSYSKEKIHKYINQITYSSRNAESFVDIDQLDHREECWDMILPIIDQIVVNTPTKS
jgi:hypothetical protein